MEGSVAELVRRAQQGESGAFEALIGRYERVALSIAYSVLGDAGEAGDAVQEGFLRAWHRLGDLQEPERFGGWLCGIVRNFALDVRRRTRPIPLSAAGVDAGAGDDQPARPHLRIAPEPGEELDRQESRQQVNAALESLDETSRTAVILRYYEGMSSKEIGDHLGLAPSAVDMRLSRARRQLKEHLERAERAGRAKLA